MVVMGLAGRNRTGCNSRDTFSYASSSLDINVLMNPCPGVVLASLSWFRFRTSTADRDLVPGCRSTIVAPACSYFVRELISSAAMSVRSVSTNKSILGK